MWENFEEERSGPYLRYECVNDRHHLGPMENVKKEQQQSWRKKKSFERLAS